MTESPGLEGTFMSHTFNPHLGDHQGRMAERLQELQRVDICSKNSIVWTWQSSCSLDLTESGTAYTRWTPAQISMEEEQFLKSHLCIRTHLQLMAPGWGKQFGGPLKDLSCSNRWSCFTPKYEVDSV